MDEDTINSITQKSSALVTIVGEQDAAYAAQQAAATELLERVLEAVCPALRAVASRIQIGYRAWWSEPETYAGKSYLDERGIRLWGNAPFERSCRSKDQGAYTGANLFLLADGTWIKLTYSGHWAHWVGALSEWTSAQQRMTTAEVVNEYDVDKLIVQIEAALDNQLKGGREKATAHMLRRAERLAALKTLL